MPSSHAQNQTSSGAAVHIDVGALRHNIDIARRADPSPSARLLAVVKANAYGHGMLTCCHAIRDIIDGWAVARIAEGVTLREAGFDETIVVMNPGHTSADFSLMASHQLTPILFSAEHIETLKTQPYFLESTKQLWIKLDTGMHRLGLDSDNLLQHWRDLRDLTSKDMILMTHLHSAECDKRDSSLQQIDILAHNASLAETTSLSLCNSAQLLASDHQAILPKSQNYWHRPGIMLYGADPLETATPLSNQLKPVMHFTAPVIAIRDIQAGESVGYNARWRAERPSRIATIAAGYADGYPRHAANGTPVGFGEHTAPLVGRVSMDMITIDITDLPQIKVGDQATLWGENPRANTVAKHADTIAYTLFTGIGNRVQRHSP